MVDNVQVIAGSTWEWSVLTRSLWERKSFLFFVFCFSNLLLFPTSK